MSAVAPASPPQTPVRSQSFLLMRVQPALSGLMDGSLSTLAPIFAVALATHRPLTAFYTGVATALDARPSRISSAPTTSSPCGSWRCGSWLVPAARVAGKPPIERKFLHHAGGIP
jgi:hypothetical protein